MAAGAERADGDAPGELLAEFLSAIMRRQYAEALKCCRLILQYEPHNATARGFRPLLEHRLRAHEAALAAGAETAAVADGGSSAECAGCGAGGAPPAAEEEAMEKVDTGSSRSRSGSAGSCCSQSSLELDSSDALAHSSRSHSLSRRTDLIDSASGASETSGATAESVAWSGQDTSSASGLSAASEGSAARWDSTATEPAPEPDADDNGNPPACPAHPRCHRRESSQVEGAPCGRSPDDVRNDNATAHCTPSAPLLKNILCQKLGLRR